MTERADKVEISCEKCKQTYSIAAIRKCQAVCACGNNTWHIQATYLARQDTADGTSLALNAMGFSVLSTSGVEIGGPIPVSKKPVNGFDIRDVSAARLVEIVDPSVDPHIKLDAFIRLKRNEHYQLHRQQMEERGQECEQCGVLYVLNDSKPWTLLGTCSKFCCAKKMGVNDYSMAELMVEEQVKQLAPEVKQRTRENLNIHVTCPKCHHAFQLPRLYGGIYRKCPQCDAKVLVPQA